MDTETAYQLFIVFRASLYELNLAQSTRRVYLSRISDFLKFCQAFESPVQDLCKPYIEYLEQERACTPRTINAAVAVLRMFIRIMDFPSPEMPLRQPVAAREPKHLSSDEVRRLHKIIDSSLNPREKTIMQLFLFCGLTMSECRHLRFDDLTLVNQNCYIVIVGKRQNAKRIEVPRTMSQSLRLPSLQRPYVPAECTLVFPNQLGLPMSQQGIDWLVRSVARRAGINTSASTLRNSFLTWGKVVARDCMCETCRQTRADSATPMTWSPPLSLPTSVPTTDFIGRD
jgi:site-specific recombinase XerD